MFNFKKKGYLKTTAAPVTASFHTSEHRPPDLEPVDLSHPTSKNGLRWKDHRGLGDVRQVRLMLQRILPSQLVDRITRDADWYYAVAYISHKLQWPLAPPDTREPIVSLMLNQAQRRSLAQVAMLLIHLRIGILEPVLYRSSMSVIPQLSHDLSIEYWYNIGDTSGEFRMPRSYCKGQPFGIVWTTECDEMRHICREGVLDISYSATDPGEMWTMFKGKVTVELSFYPNDIDYASFILSNGF